MYLAVSGLWKSGDPALFKWENIFTVDSIFAFQTAVVSRLTISGEVVCVTVSGILRTFDITFFFAGLLPKVK